MKALVGFDGSDGARDAVSLARSFCGHGRGATLLVDVLPSGGPPPPPYQLVRHWESEDSKSIFDDVREQLRDIEVETRTYAGGSPAFVLSDLAEGEQADLVIVGSPHRGAIGRALIGSVAEALLHGATIPTVTAPRGYAQRSDDGFDVIGVAYNGGPESRLALAYAQDLAAQFGATIRILTVEEPVAALPGVVGYTPPPPLDYDELIEEVLRMIDGELQAEGKRLVGPAAAALAEACDDGAIELLIAGSRGYGPVGRVLLGSVSTQLIHRAPCPVLVVPRGAELDGITRTEAASAAHRVGTG
jgi:nucleotide-binding universal stress UspA family protein